jgi:cytochrome c-type biogenesis protein CcmH
MTLWLILTIMTSAAAVWLAVPLIRRFERPRGEAAGDIEVYRDQLQEVEREVREGLIDDAQSETARIEIKRRILAADRSRPGIMPGLSGAERSLALVGATGIVVLGSVILYAVTGSPDLAATRSAAPFAAAGSTRTEREATAFPPQHPSLEEGLAIADRTRASGGDAEPSSQAGLPTVEEMTRRLAARLARNPADTEGWRTLGWSYLNIGRFAEAADAYAKAIELDPGNAEFRGGRIEALVGAADGIVTADAKAVIRDALKLDPKNVRARYFDGLAREQEGDKAAALAEWSELLKEVGSDAHSDESWASDLRTRVSALKREMGLDGGTVPDVPRLAARTSSPERSTAQAALQPPGAVVEKGPSAQDVQAAEAMLPADRAAMIRGMVDGLASRLERSPRDADGWIRLIRSRIVLGESELARQALARGLAVFADDAPERDRIAAAAQQLGVGQ